MRKWGIAIAILALLPMYLSGSCVFKKPQYKGIMSYRDGRVYLMHNYAQGNDYYKVGLLPPGWERMPTRVRAISFYNQELESSITTDAFCGRAIEGQRVGSLSGDIISALRNRKVISEEEFTLDRRGATRQRVEGEMDGVKILLDLVIVKKDQCVFDFFAVMPQHVRPDVSRAFEDFYGGFHYE